MQIAKTIVEIRACVAQARKAGKVVGFVPTMGALHDGHVSLIQAAGKRCDYVVVSIFVNPTQFGPNEDYQRYPRPIEDDLRRCRERNVWSVFKPTVEQMYPPEQPGVSIEVPALCAELEGEYRPGHLQGVCRVVAKLLNIVEPNVAIFGLKDYQQLCVIDAMVHDLAMPVEIAAAPTMREPDGLAMSSRNVYLTDGQRSNALGLHKALMQARMLIEQSGEVDPDTVEQAMLTTLRANQLEVDYAVLRHPVTLGKLDSIDPALTGVVVDLFGCGVV
jgi:pantoate--beta-alanine ligase